MPDSESLSEAIRIQRTTSLILFFLNIVCTVYVIYRLFRADWTFTPLFNDFGLELPLVTQVMMSIWMIGGLILLLLLSVGKEFILRNQRLAIVLNAIHLLLMLLVWQLYIEAIMSPFIQLIKSLSG